MIFQYHIYTKYNLRHFEQDVSVHQNNNSTNVTADINKSNYS